MEARWDISGKWCRVSWYVWMVDVLMRCRWEAGMELIVTSES